MCLNHAPNHCGGRNLWYKLTDCSYSHSNTGSYRVDRFVVNKSCFVGMIWAWGWPDRFTNKVTWVYGFWNVCMQNIKRYVMTLSKLLLSMTTMNLMRKFPRGFNGLFFNGTRTIHTDFWLSIACNNLIRYNNLQKPTKALRWKSYSQ